ncbi:MAG: GNAT family N-acetyltransferase [Myxococcaceae bacterium]
MLKIEELRPELWGAFEKLFGKNGACAGCWCMFWRLEDGERFDDVKGSEAKRRMKKLVASGAARGLIAFDDGAPVGWLALGRRREFKKLDRAPSLQCDDADQVWSLPCFFVHKDARGKGVASALLKRSLEILKRERAKVVEGYPVKPPRKGEKIPAAFAYTGTIPLFEKSGFKIVEARPKGRQRMRRAP